MQPESPTIRDHLVAKFEALLDECDVVSSQSLPAEVIDDMDEFFLLKGRKLLQEIFQAKLQERIKQDGSVLASGTSEQDCRSLYRSLFRSVETMLDVYPLKFYTPRSRHYFNVAAGRKPYPAASKRIG